MATFTASFPIPSEMSAGELPGQDLDQITLVAGRDREPIDQRDAADGGAGRGVGDGSDRIDPDCEKVTRLLP